MSLATPQCPLQTRLDIIQIVVPLLSDFSSQVDLRFLTMLTAIATQGAISRETQKGYYVKSYKLEVSTNGEDWMVYRHGKNHKVGWVFPKWAGELQVDPMLGKSYCLVRLLELLEARDILAMIFYFFMLK